MLFPEPKGKFEGLLGVLTEVLLAHRQQGHILEGNFCTPAAAKASTGPEPDHHASFNCHSSGEFEQPSFAMPTPHSKQDIPHISFCSKARLICKGHWHVLLLYLLMTVAPCPGLSFNSMARPVLTDAFQSVGLQRQAFPSASVTVPRQLAIRPPSACRGSGLYHPVAANSMSLANKHASACPLTGE